MPDAPDRKDVNLRVGERDFKYYIFDWDDNILHMPTRIHLEYRRPEDGVWVPRKVSTSFYAMVRNDTAHYRAPGGNWENAFIEFQDQDQPCESKFLTDTRTALLRVLSGEEPPAPSFETLRETLREGRLFAIVTARGHEPESLRRAVELFIETVLTPDEKREMLRNLRGYRACFDGVTEFGTDAEELDYYLSLNRYHAVTNPKFRTWVESQTKGEIDRTKLSERAKQFAIRDFVEHVIHIITKIGGNQLNRPVSVGFSDDDIRNVEVVEHYIRDELGKRFHGIKFCVYDTSDPALTDGRKVIVSGQLDLGF